MRGHIRQRAAGSWTIEKALTELLRDIDRGTVARAGADTFEAYLSRWLDHIRSRVRQETWERYAGLVRVQIVARIGRVKLEKLRPHHVQRVLDEMLADGAAPASVSKCHRVMASALSQAVHWQLLAVNPATGVSPPRVESPRASDPRRPRNADAR